MPACRFPVLVWEDHAGRFGACLIREGESVVATGTSRQQVLRQVRDAVEWEDKRWGTLYEPDLEEVALAHFRVKVWPEYRVDERVFPCDEPVPLRVACVHGRTSTGLRRAFLPLLRLEFSTYEGQSLKRLVEMYAGQVLRGLTPRELARHLEPREVTLETQAVTARWRGGGPEREAALPNLRSVADPLGHPALARSFVTPFGREEELERLVERLLRERASLVLVGESGAGRTTLLAAAVARVERALAKEGARAAVATKRRFWLTAGARLIAGMRYLGQWEERCEDVITELAQIEGVLCLEGLLDTVLAGGRTPEDGVGSFLAPFLENGDLRVVAEATPGELDACRRLSPSFADRFEVVRVPTFGREEAAQALRALAASCAANAGVEVEDGAVDAAARLFRRFQPYQAPPGPAAAFLRERFDDAQEHRVETLETSAVLEAFQKSTGLPELFLRDELTVTRDEVLRTLGERIVGQERAVRAAADLVLTVKAGLDDPERPFGVLLFCGPTGVGKTALARELARAFFGGEQERLVRLDMSEYDGPGAVERLLGSPYGSPSELVERLRRQPFCVVLLDEIEKASPEVLDALLGALDEGRLTDGLGRVTWLRSSVVVMTSNLGAGTEETVGFAEGAPAYEEAVRGWFRPELFNRIDELVAFDPLRPEDVRHIVRMELEAIARREGFERTGISLTWGEGVVEHLARAGYDARYGARPLQRAIEDRVVAPLARALAERPEWRGGALRVREDGVGGLEIEWP